jgi:hypothetical protein
MSVESRPFSYDPYTKIERIFHYDHADDRIIIENVQHGETQLELNKAAYNSHDGVRFAGDGFHHVASIPPQIVHKLMQEGRYYDEAAMKAWLNDADNRCFRTMPGRI